MEEGEASSRAQQKQGVKKARPGRRQGAEGPARLGTRGAEWSRVPQDARDRWAGAQLRRGQGEPAPRQNLARSWLCPSLLGGLGKSVRCTPQGCISGKRKQS